MTYEYVHRGGDTIAEPQTYMYSQTTLCDFTASRKKSADDHVRRLRELTTDGPPVSCFGAGIEAKLLAGLTEELASELSALCFDGPVINAASAHRTLESLDSQESWDTATTLGALLRLSVEPEHETLVDRLLIRFQRSFEVHKRVFTRYRPLLKAASDDWRQIPLYAGVAAGFGLRAARTRDLRALNVLLKINDTLASQDAARLSPEDLFLALVAFDCERVVLAELLERAVA